MDTNPKTRWLTVAIVVFGVAVILLGVFTEMFNWFEWQLWGKGGLCLYVCS